MERYCFKTAVGEVVYYPSRVWSSTIAIKGEKYILIDPQYHFLKDTTRPDEIWLTHTHPDHILSINKFEGIPVYAHPEGLEILVSPFPDRASTKREIASAINVVENFKSLKGFRKTTLKRMVETIIRMHSLPFINIKGVRGVKQVYKMSDGEKRYGIRIFYIPGHTPDSLCFYIKEDGICATGDLIMGGSSPANLFTPVSDPYKALQSLYLLQSLEPKVILPGHGYPIYEAKERLKIGIEGTEREMKCITENFDPAHPFLTICHIQRCLYPGRKMISRLSALGYYTRYMLFDKA